MKKNIITLLGMASISLVLGGCSSVTTKTSKQTSFSQSKKRKNNEKSNNQNSNEKIVQINKSSNLVGPLKVHVSSIKYEKVKNKESNWTNAEYNMEGDPEKDLNNYYYRAIVYLNIENTGNKSVDLSYGERSYIVDDGTAFPEQGGADGNSFESSTAKIVPHTKLANTVILVSNKKFTANKLQITFTDICENDNNVLSNGGTAKI